MTINMECRNHSKGYSIVDIFSVRKQIQQQNEAAVHVIKEQLSRIVIWNY